MSGPGLQSVAPALPLACMGCSRQGHQVALLHQHRSQPVCVLRSLTSFGGALLCAPCCSHRSSALGTLWAGMSVSQLQTEQDQVPGWLVSGNPAGNKQTKWKAGNPPMTSCTPVSKSFTSCELSLRPAGGASWEGGACLPAHPEGGVCAPGSVEQWTRHPPWEKAQDQQPRSMRCSSGPPSPSSSSQAPVPCSWPSSLTYWLPGQAGMPPFPRQAALGARPRAGPGIDSGHSIRASPLYRFRQ